MTDPLTMAPSPKFEIDIPDRHWYKRTTVPRLIAWRQRPDTALRRYEHNRTVVGSATKMRVDSCCDDVPTLKGATACVGDVAVPVVRSQRRPRTSCRDTISAYGQAEVSSELTGQTVARN